jgi:hypothetical protein
MTTSLYSLDESLNMALPESKHVAVLMELELITRYIVLVWTFVEEQSPATLTSLRSLFDK